jgi:HK97 family phage major capsid protein
MDTPVGVPYGGELPQQPLAVLDLVPQAPIDASWDGATGGGASYVTETARTLNAGPVDPHTAKPETALTFARGRAPVITIAHVVSNIDRWLLSDYAGLVTILNSELTYGLNLAASSQIVNGTGVAGPPQQMTGFMHTPGVLSIAFAVNALDTVASAISQLQASGVVPNAVVMSPADALAIQTAKDAQQRYYGNGPFQSGPTTLWSVPLLVDPTIPAGIALIGDFKASMCWVRSTAILEIAYVNDDFTKNQVTVRSECRLAFGVVLPSRFAKVALNNTVVIPTVEDAPADEPDEAVAVSAGDGGGRKK